MIQRHALWQRASGHAVWPMAWALAASALVPWLVPEAWEGRVPWPMQALGWALVLGTSCLLPRRGLRVVPCVLVLAWGTLGGLRRLALQDRRLPRGVQALQGVLASPWDPGPGGRKGSLKVETPRELRGLELPVRLSPRSSPPPPPGTRVRLRVELERVQPGPVFLGERPLWRALDAGAPRRIRLRSAWQMEVLGRAPPTPLLALRMAARRNLEALHLPEGTPRDLWGAMALGIPPAGEDAFSAFSESGTIHVLVVSGLHVMIVMGVLEASWRRLLGRGSLPAAVAGGCLFGALAGFSAPVCRGLVMGAAWAAGRGLGWKAPGVLALHGALLLWTMGHPAAGCDPGFLLAWMALVGLLWVAEPLAGLLSPLPAARSLASLAGPWLTTLPLLALLHGGAPLWGIPANALVLPAASILTPGCLVLTFLRLPWATGALVRFLAWFGEALVPRFARIQPLAVADPWPWIALLAGWLLLAQAHAHFRRTRALCAGLVLASLALLGRGGLGRSPPALSLEGIDVGQGDALLVRVPHGDATLIDTGPTPWSARRVARVLSRRGVREPLHLVLTHPHGDHAGGWATLGRLRPLASVSLPVTPDPEGPWRPFHPPAAPEAVRVSRGSAWRRGGAFFSVRWPPGPLSLRDANMLSVVLRVDWLDRQIWLMGDALALQEADLLELGDPGAGAPHRILKAGHHGSRSSTTDAWVEALHPELAVVTAGRENAFGHPHDETLAVLASRGVKDVLVTGSLRGVHIQAAPGGWRTEDGDGRVGWVPWTPAAGPSGAEAR
jgi:competence protein ComEC